MAVRDFYILFGVTWVTAFVYGGSMFLAGFRIRSLKASGRLPQDVPSAADGPLEGLRAVKWMLTGRYGEVQDGMVRTLALVARLTFGPALILVLAVFWITLSDPPGDLGGEAPPVTLDVPGPQASR